VYEHSIQDGARFAVNILKPGGGERALTYFVYDTFKEPMQ